MLFRIIILMMIIMKSPLNYISRVNAQSATTEADVSTYAHLIQDNQNCISDSFRTEMHFEQTELSSLPKSFPRIIWPFANQMYDGIYMQNYVDQDPAQGVFQDYMGGSIYGYRGHTGTDINLYNFRLVDKGIAVIAASAGVVTWTRYDQFDRNKSAPIIGAANGISIRHLDGRTRTLYFHFRRNSIAVQIGDEVEAGQFLGYAASSGPSTFPHLHIEFREFINGTEFIRDPWEGPCNQLPTIWKEEEPYVGNQPSRFLDMGVSTQAVSGGNLNNISLDLLKERLTQPAAIGFDEASIVIWIQLQVVAGDFYIIELVKPDGTVFGTQSRTSPYSAKIDWNTWRWSFGSTGIDTADFGIWTARLSFRGQIVKQIQFEVGEKITYRPRFWPVAGRSFQIKGTTQKDTLSVSSFGGPVSYSLIGAPSAVSLQDSIIVIDTISDEPTRSANFQVVATNSEGLTDSMYYHLVDLTKSPGPITSVKMSESNQIPRGFQLHQNFPNPFNPTTSIRYSLQEDAKVELAIFNLIGQQIRQIVNSEQSAGDYAVQWNGTNASGQRVSSGIYFYRLEIRGTQKPFSQVKKMMLLK